MVKITPCPSPVLRKKRKASTLMAFSFIVAVFPRLPLYVRTRESKSRWGRPAWGGEHEAAQRQGLVKDYLVNENTKSEIGLHQAEAAKNYAEASAARAEATMAKAPMVAESRLPACTRL